MTVNWDILIVHIVTVRAFQGDGVAQTRWPLWVRAEPPGQWSPRSSAGPWEEVHLRDPGRHSLHTSVQNSTKTTPVSPHQGDPQLQTGLSIDSFIISRIYLVLMWSKPRERQRMNQTSTPSLPLPRQNTPRRASSRWNVKNPSLRWTLKTWSVPSTLHK